MSEVALCHVMCWLQKNEKIKNDESGNPKLVTFYKKISWSNILGFL